MPDTLDFIEAGLRYEQARINAATANIATLLRQKAAYISGSATQEAHNAVAHARRCKLELEAQANAAAQAKHDALNAELLSKFTHERKREIFDGICNAALSPDVVPAQAGTSWEAVFLTTCDGNCEYMCPAAIARIIVFGADCELFYYTDSPGDGAREKVVFYTTFVEHKAVTKFKFFFDHLCNLFEFPPGLSIAACETPKKYDEIYCRLVASKR